MFWNRRCRELFGWTKEEVNLHENVMSVLYPDPAELEAAMRAIVDEPDGTFREWAPVTREGQRLTVMWANHRLPDGTVLSLGYDITQRTRSEEALRYRLEMETLVAEVSNRFVGLPKTRIDEGIDQALELIGEFTGIDRGYLFQLSDAGTHLSNTHEWCAPGIPPEMGHLQDIPASHIPWWMDRIRKKETIHIPHVEERPRGPEERLLLRQNIRSILLVPMASGGDPIGFMGFDAVRAPKSWDAEDMRLLGTVGQIIAQKLEKLRAEEALLRSERKFRSLFKKAQIGLFQTRLSDGLFLEGNPRLVEMFGFPSREEMIGKVSVVDLYVAPEARARILAELKREGRVRNIEAHFRHQDGTTRWIRYSGTLNPEEGSLHGVAAEITESKRTEKEKARLGESYRQAQKVEAIGRLAGGVAHDMNNLLTPILGYGEMLAQGMDPDDPRSQFVNQILLAGNSARNLVRRLPAFGRKQPLEYRPVDINGTITRLERLIRRTLREDIEFRVEATDDRPPIQADLGQIEQVLMNLVVNAQDARPTGGELVLRTSLARLEGDLYGEGDLNADELGARPGEYVLLSVTDTGSGMEEEVREHIFEPFFSTKGGRGTGLGLPTVFGIIRQHGGTIWVDTEPGKGTTFSCRDTPMRWWPTAAS